MILRFRCGFGLWLDCGFGVVGYWFPRLELFGHGCCLWMLFVWLCGSGVGVSGLSVWVWFVLFWVWLWIWFRYC